MTQKLYYDAPRVFNRYSEQRAMFAVNITRSGPWGNRFRIGPDGTRAEVIEKYRAWLLGQPALVARAKAELRGRDLRCCCKPLACHGDVLLEVANS